MLGYLKLAGLVGALAGVGYLYIAMKSAQANLKEAQASLTVAEGVIVKHEAQEAALIATIQDRDKKAAEAAAIVAAGDKITSDLRAENQDLRQRFGDIREGVRNAQTDDDVLRLVAGGLCGAAERLEALRAGDDHQDGAGTNPNPAGTDRACSAGALTAPTSRSVGDLALRFAATAEAAAARIRGVAKWQDDYNAVVTARPVE